MELEKALLEWLTWKYGIGVFAVFSVLSYQLKMEQINKSPFKIDKDKMITELKKAVVIYEDKLKELKEYEGESLKECLWEALQIEYKELRNKNSINFMVIKKSENIFFD